MPVQKEILNARAQEKLIMNNYYKLWNNHWIVELFSHDVLCISFVDFSNLSEQYRRYPITLISALRGS